MDWIRGSIQVLSLFFCFFSSNVWSYPAMKAAYFFYLSTESVWHIVIFPTEITEMWMGTGYGKAEGGRTAERGYSWHL